MVLIPHFSDSYPNHQHELDKVLIIIQKNCYTCTSYTEKDPSVYSHPNGLYPHESATSSRYFHPKILIYDSATNTIAPNSISQLEVSFRKCPDTHISPSESNCNKLKRSWITKYRISTVVA
ncbi:hypothetical protein FGIG_08550 [Fasciola gigantica]|uniref:Uncharacterized protein n=1 Tax=Fasciola gigantica TaxID=46835 RepID=A0A504YVI2_FASGI|nr:hypothetical protein FGIG_08550 [Fasciola gigantica]